MPSENRGQYRGYTEARKNANARYASKFHMLRIRVTPEEDAAIKEFCARHDKSVSLMLHDLIMDLIDAELEKERAAQPEEKN